MRRVRPSDHRCMPWRNGGGVTNEIAIAPEEPRSDGRFDYRISIADVVASGAFSPFPGYDRHIFLLEGREMLLDLHGHGVIELARFTPRQFSGDWEVEGRLTAGAVRDFNLIVDRAWASSNLAVETITSSRRLAGDVCIVHLLEGFLEGADPGDTLIAHGPLAVVPHGTATIAIASLAFLQTHP